MGGVGPRPVARLWELRADGFGQPGVARAFCAEVMPLVEDVSGSHSRVVLVDRRRSLLRGISLTVNPDAWAGPSEIGSRIGDVIDRLGSATMTGPSQYEVSYARYRGVHGRAPTPGEVELMRARVGLLEGGNVGTPGITAAVRNHMAGYVIDAPGCVAAFLLCDPERQALLGATLWADARSAARTLDIDQESYASIASASRSHRVDSGTFEVLVYDEPKVKIVD